MVTKILFIAQIVLACLIILLVLIQQQGAGLGAGFGDSGGGIHTERRGPEKTIFWLTVGFSILFFAVSLASSIF